MKVSLWASIYTLHTSLSLAHILLQSVSNYHCKRALKVAVTLQLYEFENDLKRIIKILMLLGIAYVPLRTDHSRVFVVKWSKLACCLPDYFLTELTKTLSLLSFSLDNNNKYKASLVCLYAIL